MASFEINWQAPEFEYRPKSISWYWTSIWDRNFLFGVFIVIAEVLLIAWGNDAPPTVNFVLTDSNLSIGETKDYQVKLFENKAPDAAQNNGTGRKTRRDPEKP
jgi:hypothetical protein